MARKDGSVDGSLAGSAPQNCKVALLLVDVVNDMEFPEGKSLRRYAEPAAKHIAALKRRAKALGIPIVYINDNFGRWQSDFTKLVRHCLDDGVRGESTVRLLMPEEDDYFVLKPKHSGFFATSLHILLKYLGTQTVILTGFASNICILYTANDAYMHDFQIYVPSDCTAAERPQLHRHALEHMQRFLYADTRIGSRIPLRELVQKPTNSRKPTSKKTS